MCLRVHFIWKTANEAVHQSIAKPKDQSYGVMAFGCFSGISAETSAKCHCIIKFQDELLVYEWKSTNHAQCTFTEKLQVQ